MIEVFTDPVLLHEVVTLRAKLGAARVALDYCAHPPLVAPPDLDGSHYEMAKTVPVDLCRPALMAVIVAAETALDEIDADE